MKEKFKLKHLDILIDEDGKGLSTLMVDILDYKNSFFGKAKFFVKNFLKIKEIVAEISAIDHNSVELNDDCFIKKPATIDSICYFAMLNLKSILESVSDLSMSEHMAKVIAISTFESNRFSKYNPESLSFKNHEEIIMNANMFDMIALYNWVREDVQKTSKNWDQLFFSVEVVDKDLQNAGGEGLSQFNVINTIKGLCSDFNVNDEEAVHRSYHTVMTNSYSKAYSTFVQENIRVKKEAEYAQNKK